MSGCARRPPAWPSRGARYNLGRTDVEVADLAEKIFRGPCQFTLPHNILGIPAISLPLAIHSQWLADRRATAAPARRPSTSCCSWRAALEEAAPWDRADPCRSRGRIASTPLRVTEAHRRYAETDEPEICYALPASYSVKTADRPARTNAPPASVRGRALIGRCGTSSSTVADRGLVRRRGARGARADARRLRRASTRALKTPAALSGALERQSWDIASPTTRCRRSRPRRRSSCCASATPTCRSFSSPGTSGEDAAVAAMRTGAHDYILRARSEAARAGGRARAARRRRRGASGGASRTRLAHLAYHDALTDLPNRLLLHDRLDAGAARRAPHRHAARAAGARSERLQGDQRHARAPRRRSRAAVRGVARPRHAARGRHGGAARRRRVRGRAARRPTRRRAADRAEGAARDRAAVRRSITGRSSVRASLGIACFPGARARPRRRCCSRPTSRCTSPRATASASPSTRPISDRHTHRRLTLIAELAAAGSTRTSSSSSTSRSCTCGPTSSSASKRWCAGTIRSRGGVLPADFIHLAEQTGPDQPADDDRARDGDPRVEPAADPCRR